MLYPPELRAPAVRTSQCSLSGRAFASWGPRSEANTARRPSRVKTHRHVRAAPGSLSRCGYTRNSVADTDRASRAPRRQACRGRSLLGEPLGCPPIVGGANLVGGKRKRAARCAVERGKLAGAELTRGNRK